MKTMIAAVAALALLATSAFAGGPPVFEDDPNIPNCVFGKVKPNCENFVVVLEDRQSYSPVFPAPNTSGQSGGLAAGLGPSGPTGLINGIDVVWSNPAAYDANGNPIPPGPPRTCAPVTVMVTSSRQSCHTVGNPSGHGSHTECTSVPETHTQTVLQCN